MWPPLILLATLLLTATVRGQFDPLLNVESCTKSKLQVSTFGAADGGLIYIQGQGDDCKLTTSSGIAMYEFDYATCGIKWEMLFKIVIQKKSGYQTGDDKQIPIFCIADRSDLLVDNSKITGDKNDDQSLNMTTKPTAFMSFFKVVSEEEVSGREVKLTDQLIMSLQLEEKFAVDFDIKARICVASNIVVIQNFCSVDTELFPNFSRFKRGYLMSEFGAFRATDLDGGAVLMNFTCVLEVCKGDCEPSTCDGGETGWARKKRDVTPSNVIGVITAGTGGERHKRAADSEFDIDVGGKVKIVEKYSEIKVVDAESFCMNVAGFVITIIFLAAGISASTTAAVVFFKKWAASQSQAAKLDGGRGLESISQSQHKKLERTKTVDNQSSGSSKDSQSKPRKLDRGRTMDEDDQSKSRKLKRLKSQDQPLTINPHDGLDLPVGMDVPVQQIPVAMFENPYEYGVAPSDYYYN